MLVQNQSQSATTEAHISDSKSAKKPESVPDGFVSTYTPVLGHEVHAFVSKENFSQSKQQIVLMHGATASRRYLMPTAKLLAQHMQVFVPEMPGHGASSRPRRGLKVAQQADVTYAWIKQNGLEQPYIFANSYGCEIAASLTARYPDVAKKLILTGPTTDPASRSVWKMFLRLMADGKHEPTDSKGQVFADLADMGFVITYDTVNEMVRHDICADLGKIKCPTLVMRGEFDTVAPDGWTREVSERIPGAVFKTIKNGPHSVNFATPAMLTNEILRFVSD